MRTHVTSQLQFSQHIVELREYQRTGAPDAAGYLALRTKQAALTADVAHVRRTVTEGLSGGCCCCISSWCRILEVVHRSLPLTRALLLCSSALSLEAPCNELPASSCSAHKEKVQAQDSPN